MALNIVKRFYLGLYRQLHVRKNLYHLRDRRLRNIFLEPALVEAAEVWPEALPWKPRTILDVGAHRGDIAEQLSILYRPSFVGLVEPLPQMAALLEARRFAPRQKFFACALGQSEGMAQLNMIDSMPSSSLLEVTPGCDVLFNRPMNTIGRVGVQVRTLDAVFGECGLDTLDLLKIDVQGYEVEVFAGGACTLSKTRLVVTEVSFFEHYKDQPLFAQVYACLHDRGFELRNLFGNLYGPDHLPLQCDAVFINRAMPRLD